MQIITFLDDLITYLDKFTIIFSAITMFITIINLRNYRKLDAAIKIIMVSVDGDEISLSQTIKRRHLTRSELQGVLRNTYDDSKPYNLAYLSKKEFSASLEKAQKNTPFITIKEIPRDQFKKFSQNLVA